MTTDHTYQPGDLVERISTGERATVRKCLNENVNVVLTDGDFWPASDCRPVMEHSPIFHAINAEIYKAFEFHGGDSNILGIIGSYGDTLDDSEILDLLKQFNAIPDPMGLAAKDNRIAELEQQLAASAEREAKMRKLCGMDLPWPLHDTVAKLVEATKAFLHKHNSDVQGWEEWHCAAQYGDDYAKQFRKAAEGE